MTHGLHDEIIMDKRVRVFLFVKRQPSLSDHVTGTRLSVFIGKEHHFELSPTCEVPHNVFCQQPNKRPAFPTSPNGRTSNTSTCDSQFTYDGYNSSVCPLKRFHPHFSREFVFTDTRDPTLSRVFCFIEILACQGKMYPACILLAENGRIETWLLSRLRTLMRRRPKPFQL